MQIFLMALVLLAIFVLIAVRLLRDRIPPEPRGASEVPPVRLSIGRAADIDALIIRLDANEQPLLFVLLAADGTINRLGSGTQEDTNRELFIGRADPLIFEQVRSHLTEAMLQSLGQTFQHQNPRGLACKLTLTFKFKDGTSNGIAFLYGSESEGIPADVAEFVTAAVRGTDPWHEDFKRKARTR